ncbi:hypothetical protein KSP39_PZI022603 [Platanthera zijinensis]|uniref:DNL-type domain-containing protein n=1 Tax=Platanthera zijinensis TaxID=2320716 RepID=A0AAP0AWJ2_9ASPA
MASARVFQRHLASIFSQNRRLLLNRSVPSAKGARSIQGKTEAEHHEEKDPKPAMNDSHTSIAVAENAGGDTSRESNAKHDAISGLKMSVRHDLAMVFTCRVCEARSVKTVCRESYEKGVVVARCGGCNNLHLIADHLGLFGEPGSIEDLLLARGEKVRRGSVDTLNLTLEDFLGGTKSS